MILDAQGRILLHPRLKAGDEFLAGQDFVQKIQGAKAGECEYDDGGAPQWCMYRTFAPWNWTVVYTMSLRDRYEAVIGSASPFWPSWDLRL